MSKHCEICYRKLGPLNFKYHSTDGKTICRQCIIQAGYGANASFPDIKKIEFETILDNYNKAPQRAKEYFDEISQQEKDSKIIKCPNCNSVDVEYMGNDKKNFSAGKAVAGVALTGSVGSLAGFTGKKGNEKWHCKKCGYTFETKT